ELFFPYFQ
ncbi:unnamed protein product, partial [Allacma fusca]